MLFDSLGENRVCRPRGVGVTTLVAVSAHQGTGPPSLVLGSFPYIGPTDGTCVTAPAALSSA